MTTAGYREEMRKELSSILQYWMDYTPDFQQGGFIGRVDETDHPHPDAPKGVVLNSRICWTFSSAYRLTGDERYLTMARRAYDYLVAFFFDRQMGGVFWSVDHSGYPLNERKQIYGQAFCLYGLSEFYRATGEPAVLHEAIALFRTIEQYSRDRRRNGYYEAFTRDWQQPGDLRLSEKDANEQKTMNTHLHILEAYTCLYRSWPDAGLRQQILDLLTVFDQYIIDKGSGHLNLFFNEDWEPRSAIISYGHDIEAAWLLHEAAEVTDDKKWIEKTRDLTLQIASAAAEGLDADGGLWYEKEADSLAPEADRLVREKHWWPQAEAMIGFLHTWQVSRDDRWWQRSLASWEFVQRYIRVPDEKEWYWGVLADHRPMPGQDKAGFWKCPYHNGRACMEIMRRLQ